jgi:capsular exopolysaccharide synthesis family protein
MDPIRYLKAFRRRWAWIVACVLVAVGAGWLTTETVAPVDPNPPKFYTADALLLSDGTGTDPLSNNLDTLAVVATTTPVLENVAHVLGYEGDPSDLATATVIPDMQTGILRISVGGANPRLVERRAAAYQRGVLLYLRERQTASIQAQIEGVDAQLAELRKSGAPPEAFIPLQQQRAQLAVDMENATGDVGLQPIAPPVAVEVTSSGVDATDVSRNGRLAIVGILGLLAGLVLALILERFDTKVRTRETAEERFGIPVLAEVPKIAHGDRKAIVTASLPTSAAADAFRLVGAGIGVVTPHPDGDRAKGRTVLVTSPGPSDGKTTLVVNIGAALAEEGARVLVVSADLRRPRIHEVFKASRTPGLVDAAQQREPNLNGLVQPSSLSNLWVLASGNRTSSPGGVLGSPQMRLLLAQARTLVDWILIDTSPLLAATESALLLPEADLVLLVAMANKTSSALARRATETLRQLEVPNVRVILNMSREVVMPAGYRRYYRRAAKTKTSKNQPQVKLGFGAGAAGADGMGADDDTGEG